MSYSPFVLEDFLASLVEALKVKGDARAVVVIIEGDCCFEAMEPDWGINYWSLRISLPVHVFYALTDDERTATEHAILNCAEQFFSSTPQDDIRQVLITPAISPALEGWRAEAARFVKGEGVTNQGRVRSDNIASQQYRGLLFRSQSEIALFEAMTRAQLAVAPLPVFVRIGKNYNRIEPDFVVIYKGLTFVVEVDGDTYHKELPADADKRLVPLTFEGVEVRRIRAEDVKTEALANAAVKDLIDFMSHRKAAR